MSTAVLGVRTVINCCAGCLMLQNVSVVEHVASTPEDRLQLVRRGLVCGTDITCAWCLVVVSVSLAALFPLILKLYTHS